MHEVSDYSNAPIAVNDQGLYGAQVSVEVGTDHVEVAIWPSDEKEHDQVTLHLDPLAAAGLAREIEVRARDFLAGQEESSE